MYEIFLFQNGPPHHFGLELLELHLVHQADFALTEELNHRRLTWYETDRN